MAGTFISIPGEVNSINGLQGDLTLAAGTNVTITPSGQTITISSSGGGGGSPGGIDTNVQFNNAGAFGGDTNLSWNNTTKTLAVKALTVNGNTVLTSATNVQTGSNIALTAPATSVVRCTNAGLSVIGSVVATGLVDGTAFILENNTGNSLILVDEFGSATATNRIRTSLGGTGVNYQINNNGSAMLIYNSTLSRWVVQGVPFGLWTAGSQTFNGDKTLNGSWTATNFTASGNVSAFSGTVSGSSVVGTSVVHSNGNVTAGADVTAINNVVASQGILGLVYAQAPLVNTALLDSVAGTSSTGTPSSFNISLNLATQLSAPSASATTALPHLQRPSSINLNQDNSGGGFIANGSSYEYVVYSYNTDLAYSLVFADVSAFDDGSFSNFTWDLSWGDAQPNSADTIQGYLVGRDINSGGFAYEDVGNTLAFNDDNSALFVAPGPSPLVNDFIANGTARQYYAAKIGTSPSGETPLFSPTTSYTYSDANNGDAYRVQHSFSGTLTPDGRVLGDDSGTALNHLDINTDFIEEPGTFSVSGDTVTPNTYGINANGSNLNLDFQLYGTATPGGLVYSSSYDSGNAIDPNDGLDYYLTMTWSAGGGNTGYKLLRSTDGGSTYPDAKVITPTNYTIDSFSTWPDTTTVTPTTSPLHAGKFTNTALSLLDAAQLEILSASASYGRLDFLDSLGAKIGAIESDTTGVSIVGPDVVYKVFFKDPSGAAPNKIEIFPSGIRFVSGGIGFFGNGPANQLLGGTHTAGALYTSNEQTMIQIMWNAFKAYGLLS